MKILICIKTLSVAKYELERKDSLRVGMGGDRTVGWWDNLIF